MTRLAPHQRKRPQISQASWDVVAGRVPIADSQGTLRPATLLIFTWYRNWLRGVTDNQLTWRGTPLQPGFRWTAPQHARFNGRLMVDVAEELEGAALEGAAKGVESYRESKDGAPLIPWMKRVLYNHLASEFRVWAITSSSTNHELIDHYSLESVVRASEENPNQPSPLASMDLSPETILGLNDGPTDPINDELVKMAFKPLSRPEAEALTLFAENSSYSEISRTLGLSGPTSAHRIVTRARTKARVAIDADQLEYEARMRQFEKEWEGYP